jgi:hypothetical protein
MMATNDKYVQERHDLINKLYDILELDDDKSFTLYELDNDLEKQDSIMGLLDDFRKYFSPTASVSRMRGQKPYMSIIKHMMKLKYTIYTKEVCVFEGDQKRRSTQYIFVTKKEYLTNYMDLIMSGNVR